MFLYIKLYRIILYMTYKLNSLSPEDNDGNIEYKWKLCDILPHKISQLTTQMLFRLTEGGGNAEYYIGVTDKGTSVGISKNDMNTTLSNLFQCCKMLDARVLHYRIYTQDDGYYCLHLKVKKTNLPCDKISI
jgi:elongation factor 1-alpha